MEPQKPDIKTAANNPGAPNLGFKKFKIKSKPLIIGLGLAALLVIAALIIFVILPIFRGPGQLLVNGRSYLYACSAFTQDDLASTYELERSEDETINEAAAFNVNSERSDIELLELTGEESIESTCTYNMNFQDNLFGEPISDTFQTTITQYADNEAASNAVQDKKPEEAKELPSFEGQGNSYFVPNIAGEFTLRSTAEASLVRDNVEISIRVKLLSPIFDETEALQKIDEVINKASERIGNGEAKQSSDFSNRYEHGGKRMTDLCKTINFGQLASDMGQVEFNPTKVHDALVSAQRSEEAKERALQATCSLTFRTADDRAAQEGKEIPPTDQVSSYDQRFPHRVNLIATHFDSAETAQEVMTDAREKAQQPTESGEERAPTEDVNLGDDALKFRNDSEDNSITNAYYIQQGQLVYYITLVSITQDEPFATEYYELNDETAGRIFELIRSVAN